MRKYTLSINIQSENKDLLENLMVTLETINGDIEQLSSVELLTVSGPAYLDFSSAQGQRRNENDELTISQRNLFLDKWAISELA
ncbi:MAG: hypothetical protein PVG20_05060 [Thioalkalispiraceae bacterium]|jgi:hypothetical protein